MSLLGRISGPADLKALPAVHRVFGPDAASIATAVLKRLASTHQGKVTSEEVR